MKNERLEAAFAYDNHKKSINDFTTVEKIAEVIFHVNVEEKILTIPEVLELLHISDYTLRKYMRKGWIKGVELNKTLFLYSDIVMFIVANKGKQDLRPAIFGAKKPVPNPNPTKEE